jgi:hypothetical protein
MTTNKIGTFREWLREEEEKEFNEAIDLSDPDKSVSYETFAKAYSDTNTRNISQLKIIQKFFKAKEEPFKQEYGGNSYKYFARLFESKDKNFKIYISSPMSTDSSDTYTLRLANEPKYAKFGVQTDLKVREFNKLNNHIIIEGLKELYTKALKKYESDESYKKYGKFVFKANLLNLIK